MFAPVVLWRHKQKELIYEITLHKPKNKPFGYPSNPQTLGERIKARRMDKGLQIQQLAEIFGVSSCTIINWEKGMKPAKRYIGRWWKSFWKKIAKI